MTSSTSFRLCPLFAHPFRSKSCKKNDLQGINWQSKSLRFLHWNRHHEKPGSLWLQQRGRKKMSKSGSYLWHFPPRLNSPAFSIDVSSAINLVRSAAGRNSVLVFLHIFHNHDSDVTLPCWCYLLCSKQKASKCVHSSLRFSGRLGGDEKKLELEKIHLREPKKKTNLLPARKFGKNSHYLPVNAWFWKARMFLSINGVK